MTPHGARRSRLLVVHPLVRARPLALALAACACGIPRPQPPAEAAAEVVARAYLDALVASDCAATRALLASDGPAVRDLCGIGRVDAYSDLRGPAATGTDASFGVTVVFRDMPRTSGWEDGDAVVFLNLARAPGGPWRVAGVGSGP